MTKQVILHLCKWLGLFKLAFFYTRRGLRVLCYHGFAQDDEALFRPRLFMTPATFKRRMEFLSKKHFSIIPLSTALRGLAEGNLPPRSLVLTIDDGFVSVHDLAIPVLRRLNFPATIYVTSYYASKGTPVFRLAIQYFFWKSKERQLSTIGLGVDLPEMVSIVTDEEQERVIAALMEYGETRLDEAGRCSLSRAVAQRLGVDFDALLRTRILSLMNADEIRSAMESGMDVELHTHRHRLPADRDGVFREITDNRAFLEPLAGRELRHLCYPSGIWLREQWPWLTELRIESATTCESGLNYKDSYPLGLKRFLDGENVSAIEFEAEVFGFTELLRWCRAFSRKAFARRRASVESTVEPFPG
jgi:peptidoglycan/xylan/chitin deacetylase (PgdA/CDA1 family)